MRNIGYFIGLVAVLICTSTVYGQKEENKPVCYEDLKYDPIAGFYFFDDDRIYEDYWEMSRKDRTKNRWNVLTTKGKTPIYDKADGTVVKTTGFSNLFYVNGESGDFLEVIENINDPPLGWIHKDDLILWDTPLVDPSTRIELKAFTVNDLTRVENVELIRKDKEFYQVYDGPGNDAKNLNSRLIYDVFFVYKYVNESRNENGNPIPGKGRYLVSEHSELGSASKLLGWIEEGRTKLWKTALCLEPNFDSAALKERAGKHIISTVFTSDFGGEDQLQNYRKTGMKGEALVGGPLRDPSLGDYSLHPRMDGEIFRYPIFKGYPEPGNLKLSTAVTGKSNLGNTGVVEGFDDAVYTQINKKRKEMAENMQFKNIVFLIDGTEGMQKYIALVKSYLNDAFNDNVAQSVNTISYGAVLYKNERNDEGINTNPESEFVKLYPKRANAKQLAADIDSYTIGEAGTKTDGEAVYYAMKKAMDMLVPNQSNVIIHIGNAPDNSVINPFFQTKKSETNLTSNDLGMLLRNSDVDLQYVNFIGYSESVKRSTREDFFTAQCDDILPALATAQSNKIFGVDFVIDKRKPEAPALITYRIPGAEVATMTKSAFEMKSYLLTDYNTDKVSEWMVAELDTCDMRTEEFLATLKKVVDDDSPLSNRTGDFDIPILSKIIDELLKDNAGNEKMLNEFKEWCATSKVQLFVKAETFYKCDKLEYPLFKFVLFMNEEKLDNKITTLRNISTTIRRGDDKETLAEMQKYWIDIAGALIGGSKKDKSIEKITISQLQQKVNGIEGDGIILPNNIEKFGGIEIGDLMKKSKLSADQEKAMSDYFLEVHKKLSELKDQKVYYQVIDGGPKYYWVPLEYVFG